MGIRPDSYVMADGEFIVKLDEATAERLRAAADAAGQSVDAYAAEVLAEHIAADDVEEDLQILAEYEHTGAAHSLEEGMVVFDAAVKRWFETKAS
jgi:hypothetical protein